MSSLELLDAKQQAWAKRIVHVVQTMDDPRLVGHRTRMADLALACVRVESVFKMYANKWNKVSMARPHDAVGSDHGSVGLFQQQVGGAPKSTANWGTTAQCMNYKHSTQHFVLRALEVPGWLKLNKGVVVQKVQGSARPDAYGEVMAWAVELRKELWTPAPVVPQPVVVKPKVYVVQKNDTLTLIAKRHGMSMKKLQTINHISNPNKIYVGQKLKLS